jgi:phage terminase Nu1 subunit (DNA packaging protein)
VLLQYLSIVQSLEKQFKGFTIQHIDRSKNEEANALAKAAARGYPMPSDVFFQIVEAPIVRHPDG